MVQHGSKPVETPGSPGYQLARSIRKARSQGLFNAAELAELDQEAHSSATGHEEEAQSSATSQRRKDDKPLLGPPEIDEAKRADIELPTSIIIRFEPP